MWLRKLTALNMTQLGWLGRKTSTQTNKLLLQTFVNKQTNSTTAITCKERRTAIQKPLCNSQWKNCWGLREKTKRAHDVYTTSSQRRCNVMHMTFIQHRLNVDATSWRCIDVEATLYRRHVPVGTIQFLAVDTLALFRGMWLCQKYFTPPPSEKGSTLKRKEFAF